MLVPSFIGHIVAILTVTAFTSCSEPAVKTKHDSVPTDSVQHLSSSDSAIKIFKAQLLKKLSEPDLIDSPGEIFRFINLHNEYQGNSSYRLWKNEAGESFLLFKNEKHGDTKNNILDSNLLPLSKPVWDSLYAMLVSDSVWQTPPGEPATMSFTNNETWLIEGRFKKNNALTYHLAIQINPSEKKFLRVCNRLIRLAKRN